MVKNGNRKICKKSAREMLCLGHFEFRQRILNKLENKVHIVSEEYTSKTCTNCGNIDTKLRASKTYKCLFFF